MACRSHFAEIDEIYDRECVIEVYVQQWSAIVNKTIYRKLFIK